MNVKVAFDGITHVSFDCYGTLIDWESGIVAQAGSILASCGAEAVEPARVLRAYVAHEAELESGPSFMPYRTILAETMRRIGEDFEVQVDPHACARFAGGLADWPAFADTRAALERLASRFELVILSNVDDDLFAATARTLGVDFAAVITAQQVHSYKPALNHFHAARDRLGLSPKNWLHVAQSLHHDHIPAKTLGLRTIWVDRPSIRSGLGLSPPADAKYDARTTTLAQVADVLGV
jgi:2-haloacid dehalogenase